MPLPKDEKEAKRHWSAQEPSLERPYKTRDKGLTQVDNPKEIRTILEREAEEGPVATYKARTPRNIVDPVARAQSLTRSHAQDGMDSEAFRAKCETPEDYQLWLAFYGDMKDRDRGQLLNKLSAQLWDRQKELLKQVNIDRAHEDKKLRNQVALAEKLSRFKKQPPVIDAEVTDEGDSK